MEKNRDIKLVLVTVLAVGIIGLSIGFAAFSNVLRISTAANVTPDEGTFNVDFSALADEAKDGKDILTASVSSTSLTDYEPAVPLTGSKASIDNSGDPTISGLTANFFAPGQKVTYSFFARNVGELDAYLKGITYANATGQTSNKVCTATDAKADDTLVQKACQGIVVKVKVGNDAETTGSMANITNHKLLKSASEPITVTIEYQDGSAAADTDFTVSFGDISLLYSSAD